MPHLTPFQMSLALSAGLSAVWMYTHPDVLTHIARPQVADVAQLYSLASVALGNVFNLLVVGPMTSRYRLFHLLSDTLHHCLTTCVTQDHVPAAQAGEGRGQDVQ
jgi:hypothetical protein